MGEHEGGESSFVVARRGERPRELPEGWGRPRPEHLPRPTYWPAVMAVGITVALWGLITTWFISAVGLALFGVALWGWIGELRHEHE